MQYTCHPIVAQKLIEREVTKIKNHIDRYIGRKVAIFPAGNYGQKAFSFLKSDFGVVAECFIDNNPNIDGLVEGIPVLFEPWKMDPEFKQKYFIIIATKPIWVKQISSQLSEVGVPHISSDAYTAALLWERAKSIVSLLDDDYSRASYLGLVWYWLTHDTTLCQSTGNQYFDVMPFFSPMHETIVDLGAYVGDTTEEYVRRSLGACKVYAFEPDQGNCEALELRLKRLRSEWRINETDLISIQAGAGAKTLNMRFKSLDRSNSSYLSDLGEKEVNIYALDDFFKDILPPTIIKADIEGAEQEMLYGAEGIIKNHKPKIAICIYHFPHDFERIGEIIKGLNAAYNFAVRTHSSNFLETVLYCY